MESRSTKRRESGRERFGQAASFGQGPERRLCARRGQLRVAEPSNSVSLPTQQRCWESWPVACQIGSEEPIQSASRWMRRFDSVDY